MTIELEAMNFPAEVLQSDLPVLVDFWAEGCGPCKMIAPVLEEIAAEHAGRVKIAKVNVDQHPALAGQYQVRSIPTLLYFARGQVRDQLVGAAGKKAIESRLAALSAGAREDDQQKN